MIPFKKFMNKIPNPVRKIGGGLSAASFGLNILKGIAQGKHKKRRIFKKEGS